MTWPRWLIGASVLVLFVTSLVILVTPPAPAQADCGADASTCKNCHEGDQQKPVNTVGLYHSQHAFGDFCAQCHGGDKAAADKTVSHQGMHPVLADLNTSCASCHASDYAAKAVAYTEKKDEAAVAAPAPPKLPPPGSNNLLFAGINALVFLGLGGLIWGFERGPLVRFARRPVGGGSGLAEPFNPLARRGWSPYWAGAGLGLVATLALWISEQPLGSSGAFITITSGLLAAVNAPLSQATYFKFVAPPQITWQLMLVAGVVLGALVSSLWGRDFRLETAPDLWTRVFGEARWKRWIAMFAGGAILEFGASIAGGCTSGLAIAGSLQLSAAGFLFIGALFATGLVTARLLYGRHY